MKNFFKRDISTNMGVFVLVATFVLVFFLTIPVDYSVYDENHITLTPGQVDVSKEGVHENASPDESCRLSEDGADRDVLVYWFDGPEWEFPKGKIWVPNSDVDSLFPDIYKKIDANCRDLTSRGLEPFVLKPYKEGVFLQEGAICLAMARFCGIPRP